MIPRTKYKLLHSLYSEIESAYDIILDQCVDPENINLGKYSESMLSEACFWLETYIRYIIQNYDLSVDIPDILGGPGGSIDLIWQKPQYRILININLKGDISIYGDSRDNTPKIMVKYPRGLSTRSSFTWSIYNELYELQTYFL